MLDGTFVSPVNFVWDVGFVEDDDVSVVGLFQWGGDVSGDEFFSGEVSHDVEADLEVVGTFVGDGFDGVEVVTEDLQSVDSFFFGGVDSSVFSLPFAESLSNEVFNTVDGGEGNLAGWGGWSGDNSDAANNGDDTDGGKKESLLVHALLDWLGDEALFH